MKALLATIGLALVLTAVPTRAVWAKESAPPRKERVSEPARNELSYAPSNLPDAPDTAAMLRRLVVGTAIVLVLCVATLWIGRRWLRGAPAGAGSGNSLRLIESVSLGNRCAIHLLQAGDHQVLVGVDSVGVKSMVPLPASFEQAIAEVEPHALATPEPIDDQELQAA